MYAAITTIKIDSKSLESLSSSSSPQMSQLSANDVRVVRKLFNAYDKKHDGTIDIDDMAFFCKCLGCELSNDQLIQLLILSRSKYHYYDFSQCMTFVSRMKAFQKHGQQQQQVNTAYKAYCENGDYDRGVSFTEFRHVQQRVSKDSTDERNEEVFRKYDADCDGYLDQKEFDDMMHKKQ